jgi:trimeric autotransporter adhesin
MKNLHQTSLLAITALMLAGTAFAQVPSSNDTSDAKQNTGMGSFALGGPAATNGGLNNTAVGYETLYSNTTGTYNTASGDQAIYSNTSGLSNSAFGYQTLFSNTTGGNNTASGFEALMDNTTGNNNTASGYDALQNNSTGSYNAAFGMFALFSSQTGSDNTAVGYEALNGTQASGGATGSYNTGIGYNALYSYSTGTFNTASGFNALYSNTTGTGNTADGADALTFNTAGNSNTAIGLSSLQSNTVGDNNTASGYEALYSNTGGNYNNASGYFSLHNNSSGSQNSASGVQALFDNKTGNYNTASGTDALYSNTTGSTNIAEGYKAGFNLTTGSNNIDIGSPGAAAESGVIRIGTITGTTSTQLAAYIAGIYGVKTGTAGMAVVIDSSGQLGTVSSSIRYKEDIQPMADASERLSKLRPVTFRFKKADASGEKPVQYGLIAEEVAAVYPELAVRNATTGRVDGVRYDELAPMLLNELQRQQRTMTAQTEHIAAQAAEIRDLKQRQLATRVEQLRMQQQMAELKASNRETQAALQKLQGGDELVVKR